MEEDTTELDKAIQQYITVKTPSQIAQIVGTTPEEVIRRAGEMKEEVDALTIQQSIYFLTTRLNQIAIQAQTDAQNAKEARDKGGLYSAAVGAIRESLKQLNLVEKKNDQAVELLNHKRMLEILRLFDTVVSKGVKELVATHGLDEDKTLAVFQDKIVESARAIDGA